jgi:hypothetical protein
MKRKVFLALALFAQMAVGVYAQTEADFMGKKSEDGKSFLIFEYKGKETTVNIPARIQNLPVSEFYFKNNYIITSVIIPSGITKIPENAFERCYNLTSVTIPNSVIIIGDFAFSYCESLKSIIIPSSVTSIGATAFSNCESLTAISVDDGNTTYISQDGILYNKNKTILVKYPEGKKEFTFAIPDSVTTIADYALVLAPLSSVNIPDSITNIGRFAFSDSESLTNVTLGKSVTIIGDAAFACSSLSSITIPNSVIYIGGGAFYWCDKLTSVTFANGSNIHNDNFGINAFPEGKDGDGGNALKTAYSAGKAGTYIRQTNGSTWTKK